MDRTAPTSDDLTKAFQALRAGTEMLGNGMSNVNKAAASPLAQPAQRMLPNSMNLAYPSSTKAFGN